MKMSSSLSDPNSAEAGTSTASSILRELTLFQAVTQFGANIRNIERTVNEFQPQASRRPDRRPDARDPRQTFYELLTDLLSFAREIFVGVETFLRDNSREMARFTIEHKRQLTQEFRQYLTRLQIAQCHAVSFITSADQLFFPVRHIQTETFGQILYQKQILAQRIQACIAEVNEMIRQLETILAEACPTPAYVLLVDPSKPKLEVKPLLVKKALKKGKKKKKSTTRQKLKRKEENEELFFDDASSATSSQFSKRIVRRFTMSNTKTDLDKSTTSLGSRPIIPFIFLAAATCCLILAAFVIWLLHKYATEAD